MKDRLPPHSPEAERGLMGCVLLDPVAGVSQCRDAFPDGEPFLYDTRLQTVFDACEKLAMQSNSVGLPAIIMELEKSGSLEHVGGFPFVSSLTDSVPSAANLPFYLDEVREKWLLRSLIRTCTNLVADAYESTDAPSILDRAEADILRVARGTADAAETTWDGHRLAKEALRSVEERWHEAEHPETALLTGFHAIDSRLRLRGGHMIVIAARPSVGKTSLAVNIAINVAKRGHPVGFVTCEMDPVELAEQIGCILGQVDSSCFNRPPQQDDMNRFGAAMESLARLPIFIEPGFGLNIHQLKNRIRRMVTRHKLRLVFVDYLQLIDGAKRHQKSRTEEVGEVSRGFKLVAHELGIPVVVLSQLNRDIERGAYRRPKLADLRESGAIEQDADGVWFVHPLKEDWDSQEVADVDIVVAKQRRGRRGPCAMTFQPRYTTFSDREVKISEEA